MKYLLLLLVFFVSICDVTASENPRLTLKGRVTDSLTGAPLPGATIYFADARIGTQANENGDYEIDNVPPGHHLIEVSHTGFNSIVEHIDLTNDMVKNFSLVSTIVENAGVTVTGVISATSIRRIPIPVVTIRRTELLQHSSTNIIDALSKKPGMNQLTSGPGISKPIIRGLGYNRVVVINDGSRQEGQQWGDEHGIEIDDQSVNRIEIVKGPASLMYGSDAIAGVIHIISNVPLPEGETRGNVLLHYQTNNNLLSTHASIGNNRKGINWNLYGSLKSAADYKNKIDGPVLNSRFNEKNGGGYFGINKSWGFTHLNFSLFSQEVGLIEGDRDDATGKFLLYGGTSLERIATENDFDSRKIFIPRQNIRHYKISSDNSVKLGSSRLKILAGYQQNLREEFGNPEDEDEKELFFDLKTFNYHLHYVLPEKNEWNTTIGMGGMFQSNENRGEEAIIPDYNISDAGIFAYSQRSFEKITLSGGVRFDLRNVKTEEMFDGPDLKFESFNRNFSNVSGSLGASFQPVNYITAKLNIARGFRAPNLAELGSNGAHEGTNRYEYGSIDLKSETSLQLDAGVDIDYEHFSLSLAAFHNSMHDFIYYRKLESVSGGDSTVLVDGENLLAFRFDQEHAKLSGLEATFDLHPHPLDWLHFENRISVVNGNFKRKIDGTDNLPMIPPVRLISELRAGFPKAGKSFKNFYARFEAEHNFEQNDPFFAYNTETRTPAYTLLSAGVGSDISAGGKTMFSIHLAALNIGNAGYQQHLSRLKYLDENNVNGKRGVFNMGRNYSIKIHIPLNFTSASKS